MARGGGRGAPPGRFPKSIRFFIVRSSCSRVHNVSNARNMMPWYKNELLPNDISSTPSVLPDTSSYCRDTNNYVVTDSSETEKTLGKTTHAREYYT